jgi:RimJ/RimL family protein N-acetyltransferase
MPAPHGSTRSTAALDTGSTLRTGASPQVRAITMATAVAPQPRTARTPGGASPDVRTITAAGGASPDVRTITAAGGASLHVRPITAGDRERLAAAFDALSERSRHLRFLAPKPRLSSAELTYLTDIDHRTHEALVAVEPASGRIVAVARYAAVAGVPDTADVAFVVADEWQGRGVGTRLIHALRERAIENGLARLVATTLHDNRAARVVLRRAGFRTRQMAGGILELALELTPAE